MWAWQFATAQHVAERHGWTPFATMQNHYNLLYREEEREMLPLCADLGVGVLPWSPLARGLLAAGRDRATTRAASDPLVERLYEGTSQATVDAVADVAGEHDATPAQVALAWLLHQPTVTAPIVGASKPGHLEQAVAAIDLELSADDLERLTAHYTPRPVLGHD